MTIDPLGGRTSNLYDEVGNLTWTTDSDNNTTTFAYDALNQVTSQTDPNGHHGNFNTFTYNTMGLVTDTERCLGAADRVPVRCRRPDDRANVDCHRGTIIDQRLTFTYDNDGNQLTAADSNGAYTLSYDGLNRSPVAQEPFGQTLTFSYDAQGNRTVVQDSQGGTTTSVYDDNGSLCSGVRAVRGRCRSVDLTYNELGQNSSITRYNSLAGLTTELVATTSFSYDVYGRETTIQHSNSSGGTSPTTPTPIMPRGKWRPRPVNGVTITYTYDADGELTGDGTSTQTYDANGTRDNGSNTVGTDNQLTSDGTWNYSYDADGNLVEKIKARCPRRSVITPGDVCVRRTQRNDFRQGVGGPPRYLALQRRRTYKYDAYGNRIEEDRIPPVAALYGAALCAGRLEPGQGGARRQRELGRVGRPGRLE